MTRRLRPLLLAAAAVIGIAVFPANAGTTPAGAPDAGSVPCGWTLKENGAHGLSFGWPDNNATYWYAPYVAVPGGRLVIHGKYPRARFFTIDVYDSKAVPYEPNLLDARLHADPRGANPFIARSASASSTFTAYVEFAEAPAKRAVNTIYAGTQSKSPQPNAGGLLILRTYLPDDPTSDNGGVPLPTISLERPSQPPVILAECAQPERLATQPLLLSTISAAPPVGAAPFPLAQNPPQWTPATNPGVDGTVDGQFPQAAGVLPRTGLGLLTTPGNAFIATRISSEHGQVFVIRAKAPTTPNTRAGQWRGTPTQLRYWSVCEFSTATGQTVGCLADHDIALDRGGYFTVVISTAAARPRNAKNWLPIGDPYEGWPTLRQALAAPSFHEAIQHYSSGDLRTALAAYFPVAGYCSTEAFEAQGARCIS